MAKAPFWTYPADAFIVSVSGGRDSMASLLLAAEAAKEMGKPLTALYVDNGFQWPGAWEYIEANARRLGAEPVKVKTKTSLLDEIERRGRWPRARARYCTREKVNAFEIFIRRRFSRRPWVWRVVAVSGERRDESRARRFTPEISIDKSLTGRGCIRIVYRWRPVAAWSLDDVRQLLRKYNIEEFYPYSLSVSRVGCLFCPLARMSDLRISARHNPMMARKVLRLEKRFDQGLRADASLKKILEEQ